MVTIVLFINQFLFPNHDMEELAHLHGSHRKIVQTKNVHVVWVRHVMSIQLIEHCRPEWV